MNSLPNSSLIAFVAVIVVVVLLSKISNILNPKSKEYLIYMKMCFFKIWIKDTCMYKLLKKNRILWSKTLLLQHITLWASHIAKCSTKTCFLHCLNILNKISLLDGKKINQIKQITTNRLYFNKREWRSTNTKQF